MGKYNKEEFTHITTTFRSKKRLEAFKKIIKIKLRLQYVPSYREVIEYFMDTYDTRSYNTIFSGSTIIQRKINNKKQVSVNFENSKPVIDRS